MRKMRKVRSAHSENSERANQNAESEKEHSEPAEQHFSAKYMRTFFGTCADIIRNNPTVHLAPYPFTLDSEAGFFGLNQGPEAGFVASLHRHYNRGLFFIVLQTHIGFGLEEGPEAGFASLLSA